MYARAQGKKEKTLRPSAGMATRFMVQYRTERIKREPAYMTSGCIIEDSRVARVRELKAELAQTKARLAAALNDRDALSAHFALALAALRDFEQLGVDAHLRIIDGWNAILRGRNVSKLSSDEISKLKAEYLAVLGIVPSLAPNHPLPQATPPTPLPTAPGPQSVTTWIVFDGPEENSYRSGHYRVTYTGGNGPQRADRMILDYVHAALILGLDVSRIVIETADKALGKKLKTFGAEVVACSSLTINTTTSLHG